MNLSFDTNRRSATVKVAAIGILILTLLIPLGMVKSVVYDRIRVADDAMLDIRDSWGGDQIIAGPLLRIPFVTEATNQHGEPYRIKRHILLVADNLVGTAIGDVEKRYRGIHEVLVYRSDLEMTVLFDIAPIARLNLDPASIQWSEAEMLIGMSDRAAMNDAPLLTIGDREVEFASTALQVDGLPQVLSADIGRQLAGTVGYEAGTDTAGNTLATNLQLSFNGTGSLQFVSMAEHAEIRVSANWPSPSFSGRRLPAERTITAEGFDAVWQSTSIGRNLPPSWIAGEAIPSMSEDGIFGVRFMTPIGLYQLVDRALKYAILFIGLTFISYFLMETVAKIRLHPLQYLLVGLANSLFYLLLLSLAEHIGFGVAYVVSSTASAALIVGYSATVLGDTGRTRIMAVVLAGLYGFLYLTLMAESFALLAGSIGLWCILGAIMYMTRKIDWYSTAPSTEGRESV